MVWFWLVFGAILVFLEFVLPGLIVVFLGAAALIVGWALHVGWLSGLLESISAWFVVSLVLIISLRSFCYRLMPGETETHSTDEDFDAFGKVVEVVQDLEPNKPGRIRFQDSTWPAICYGETIPSGQKAKIVTRDNLMWVVEPHKEIELT